MSDQKLVQLRRTCVHIFQQFSEQCIRCGASEWDKDYDENCEPAPRARWQDEEEWTSDF